MAPPTKRFPRRVHVGRGYVINVQLVSAAELADLLDEEPGETAGMWDVDKDTIYVRRDLPQRRRWEAYWHEMLHAIHDIAIRDHGGI